MIGARLRTLRRWRGMTQAELAGLSGLSPSFLSMVEHGKRMLDRRSHIAALAGALRVSETDLAGGPHLSADPVQSDPHMAIPPLRAALQINRLDGPVIERARPLPDLVREIGTRIDPLRARSDYSAVGKTLPDVLDELYAHVASPAGELGRQQALAALVEACVAANELASVTGYADLAHLAALRAEEAAVLLEDPVQRGKAAVLSLFAYPQEHTWDRRLRAAERAADALEPHARNPLAYQVLGMLTLHAAMAATVIQRPHVISHWLGEAAQLAGRIPDDPAGNWQYFSATNVGIWRLAIGVERGESGGAVLEMAKSVSEEKIGVRSRRAMHLADIGRGLAREPKTRAEAVRVLRRAEETAPQLIRNSTPVREAVAYLLSRATAAAVGRELRGMAARMGVPH